MLCYHAGVGFFGDMAEQLNKSRRSILDFPNSVSKKEIESLINSMEKTGHIKVKYTEI